MILKRLTKIKGFSGKCLIKCDYCNKESVRKIVNYDSKRNYCNMECYRKYLLDTMLLKQKNKQKELISNC